MATTVGEAVLSDELVVAQSDKIALGTEVQTLVIEFDQSKYEEFLSSRASSPVKARKCRRVSYEASAHVASAESPRVNLEDRSPSPKDEAPKSSQQAKKWVVKRSNPTSGAASQALASNESPSAFIKAGPSEGPLSRRAKQRQRQNQARRRARALVSFDGFHYRPKDDQHKSVKVKEAHDDKGDEPRFSTPSGEPRFQPEVPIGQKEHCPNDEPRLSAPNGEPCLQSEVPGEHNEHRPNVEPRRLNRARRRRGPTAQARQPRSREPRLHGPKFPESIEDSPISDLRDYLTRKRSVSQIQSHCCCERLVSAVLAQCPSTHQPSVFERLSDPSVRKRRFRRHRSPGVTVNMVGRSKSRTSMDSPESSDPEYSPGLREALVKGQGVYQRTRVRTGAAIPLDYRRLAGGTYEEPENSGMATSQPSNTDLSEQASVHMADKEEEMARKIEEQQAIILAQQESIKRLEVMMEKLAGKKKVDEGGSKSKHEANEEEHEAHSVSSEAESNHRTKERDHKLHDFQK